MLLYISMCHPNVVWKGQSLSQIASEAIWEDLNSNFSGGGGHPRPPYYRHAYLCVCECAFALYYHPATILFPPNSKSCMKPCKAWSIPSYMFSTINRVSVKKKKSRHGALHIYIHFYMVSTLFVYFWHTIFTSSHISKCLSHLVVV